MQQEITVRIGSFWRTAGTRFHWEGDKRGVGIHTDTVMEAKSTGKLLRVICEGEERVFHPDAILTFCKIYSSYFRAENQKLCVVQWPEAAQLKQMSIAQYEGVLE